MTMAATQRNSLAGLSLIHHIASTYGHCRPPAFSMCVNSLDSKPFIKYVYIKLPSQSLKFNIEFLSKLTIKKRFLIFFGHKLTFKVTIIRISIFFIQMMKFTLYVNKFGQDDIRFCLVLIF